ncbi:ankyrin repeat-containing domain protein [Cyathus striatus]|nr:ankyrin repeat-containing domain protein [Cyathus striatus]
MAEKDATARLRRAVKENNLFLVKRLVQKTDMRNPDPAPKRYTSLAWAAVLGHEETFEFLLTTGHDDDELSKDSENNTILMLLADYKPPPLNPYTPQLSSQDSTGAVLRMARMYYDRYSWILDWSNAQGKTALHIAALKGNEELVRMFCDLGADIDLSDNLGNTPLHYASAWGHIPIVQLLIERGCQYAAKNNEGFTASDYAYSFSTRDTLQDTARLQYENNKKLRRQIFAQAAERGNEWGGSSPMNIPPPVPAKDRDAITRMRSGSGTSRTTATSDSGDLDSNGFRTGQSSLTTSSSPPQPSTASSSVFHSQHSAGYHSPNAPSRSSLGAHSISSKGSTLAANPPSALSPIVSRMRERDADAMEKYLMRNRSGSQGTSSTDNRSQNSSNYPTIIPSATSDDVIGLTHHSRALTPRRLRPSMSAAQLRSTPESNNSTPVLDNRHRSGTNPTQQRPVISPIPLLTRSSSISNSLRSVTIGDAMAFEEPESYVGPPSQYAQFPEPPLVPEDNSTPTPGRRKAFHLLPKPLQGLDSSSGHRRGMSATAVRGA